MDAGSTLRILDERQFEVIWTADGWRNTQVMQSRSLGSAGFSADIQPEGKTGGTVSGPFTGRSGTPGLGTMWKSR